MSQPEMIPTEINGRWELLLPAHRAARPEWVAWEQERLHSMNLNIMHGDVVYDVGTEEGDLSALFAMWCNHGGAIDPSGPHGSICIFEPNPLVLPNVKAIFEANNLPPPSFAWQGFVGSEDKTAEVWEPMRSGWPDSADGPLIGDHGFLNLCERPDVSVITIDTFDDWANLGVDIITMDVEGAEWEVLKGARQVLLSRKPLVYTSVHPEFMSQMYGQHSVDMKKWMLDLGYKFEILGFDHELHMAWYHTDGRQLL